MNELAVPAGTDDQPIRWRSLFAAAFAALLWTALVFFVLGLAAVALGVLGWRYEGTGETAFYSWPYEADGLFSLVANATVAIAFVGTFALIARSEVARRTGVRLSLPVIAVIALVAAYLPVGPGSTDSGGAWVGALILSTVGLRLAVAAGTVVPGDFRLGRRARLGAGVLAAMMVAAMIAYGTTHPLWYGAAVATGSSAQPPPLIEDVADGDRISRTFTVHSVARFNVTVDRWETLGDRAVELELADPPRLIAGRQTAFLDAVFVADCPRLGAILQVDGIRARYRLAGLSLTQPIRFRDPLRLVCNR